jgi:hypothetical protein
MISSKSLFLSKQLVRRAQPCLGVLPARNFASPAYKRYKKKQASSGDVGVPSLEVAKSMPKSFAEMDNSVLMRGE